MPTDIKFKRGIAASLEVVNPVLAHGEPAYATDTKVLKIGDGTTAWNSLETHKHTHNDVNNTLTTPDALTANTDNYSLGAGGILRLSSSAAVDITGFVATVGGDARLLANVGGYNITLKNQSTSSTDANRIIGAFGADVVIAPNTTCAIFYDSVDSRWRAG